MKKKSVENPVFLEGLRYLELQHYLTANGRELALSRAKIAAYEEYRGSAPYRNAASSDRAIRLSNTDYQAIAQRYTQDSAIASYTASILRQWDTFARHYTQNGQKTDRLETLNILQDMAFGKGAASVIASHPDFNLLRDLIEHVCLAISKETQNPENREIDRLLIKAFADQWMNLRNSKGLDASFTREDKIPPEIKEKRAEFLKLPEAKILASSIWTLNSYMLTYTGKHIENKLRLQHRDIPISNAYSDKIYNYFLGRLFKFNGRMSFSGYLFYGLGITLEKMALSTIKREKTPSRFPLHDNIPAEPAPDGKDHSMYLINLLDNSDLDRREKEIILLHYGLNGGEPLTLQQIGDYFNVSRETIRKSELAAFSKMRRIAGQETEFSPNSGRNR